MLLLLLLETEKLQCNLICTIFFISIHSIIRNGLCLHSKGSVIVHFTIVQYHNVLPDKESQSTVEDVASQIRHQLCEEAEKENGKFHQYLDPENVVIKVKAMPATSTPSRSNVSSTETHSPLRPRTTNTDTEPISADPSNEPTKIAADITTTKVPQPTPSETITEERSTSVKPGQLAKTTSSATTTQEIDSTDTHKTHIKTTTTAASAYTSTTTVNPKQTASSTASGTTTIEETAKTTSAATELPVETSPVGTVTPRQPTTPGSHVPGMC